MSFNKVTDGSDYFFDVLMGYRVEVSDFCGDLLRDLISSLSNSIDKELRAWIDFSRLNHLLLILITVSIYLIFILYDQVICLLEVGI